MPHRLHVIRLMMLGLLLPACEGPDFGARTALSGYRVVGIVAEPPTPAVDGAVELTVHDFEDSGEPVDYRWSLCLVEPGTETQYTCPEGLSVPFEGGASVGVDLGPEGLDLRTRLAELGTVHDAHGVARDLDAGVSLMLLLDSGQDCAGCGRVQTVKRLRVIDSAEGEAVGANDNPVVEAFDVDGTARPGALLELSVEVSEAESYREALRGEQVQEAFLYTWYTSLGDTDPGLTAGETRATELQLPEDAEVGDSFELVVAVRDGRGGLAVARRELEVVP